MGERRGKRERRRGQIHTSDQWQEQCVQEVEWVSWCQVTRSQVQEAMRGEAIDAKEKVQVKQMENFLVK